MPWKNWTGERATTLLPAATVSASEPTSTSSKLIFLLRADTSAEWQDLQIAYDGFKNEAENFKDGLRKFCELRLVYRRLTAGVSWTLKPDANTDVVVADELSTATNPSLAVCYGVPIVTPAWLTLLSSRLKVCWKKNADAQDSFLVPDLVEEFTPKMKEGLQAHRADPGSWRSDPANRTLFEGYCVIGLMGPKKVSSSSCTFADSRLSRTACSSRR